MYGISLTDSSISIVISQYALIHAQVRITSQKKKTSVSNYIQEGGKKQNSLMFVGQQELRENILHAQNK